MNVYFKRGKDKKKREERNDKGKKRNIRNLVTIGSVGGGLIGLAGIDKYLSSKQNKKQDPPPPTILPIQNDKPRKSDKYIDNWLKKLFEEDSPVKTASKEEIEAAQIKWKQDLEQYRRNKPAKGTGLFLDNPEIDKLGKSQRITKRLQNLDKLNKGSDGLSLATDLAALKNKTIKDPKLRKEVIKKVAARLKFLKTIGKFNIIIHLADFSKPKHNIRRGEKLSTKVKKMALPTALIGASMNALTGNRKYGIARRALKGGITGASIGAGLGAATWLAGPRSPIKPIRQWQERRIIGSRKYN